MMDKNKLTILFGLAVVLLLAGCSEPPEFGPNPGGDDNDDGNGGQGGQTTGENGVTVFGPTCTIDGRACADAEATEFSIPKITVSVKNTGEEPARISLNEGSFDGRNVLVSKCPQYSIKEFRAEVSQQSSVRDVSGKKAVSLQPDETLDMTWFVELGGHVETADTTISCLFRFQTSFSQRLMTVKQVQVRGSEDIPRTSGLTYETTATHPVELVIDSDNSIVQQMIGGESTPLQAKSYLVNRGQGTITSAQYRNGQERIRLTIPGLDRECSERSIEIRQGEERSRDTGMLCKFVPEQIESSQVYELRAETTYNYRFNLPPVEIALRTLEGQG